MPIIAPAIAVRLLKNSKKLQIFLKTVDIKTLKNIQLHLEAMQ